jgi:hypothetical protein
MNIDISKCFSDGLKAYGDNFRVLILISFTGSIPSFFSNLTPEESSYHALFLLLALIVELWAMGAVLFVIDRAQRGGKTGVTEAFDLALGKLPRLLGYTFLYALVLMAGFAALILPGFYLWPKYMFVQFESVFGEKGTNPFSESSRLTKGSMMTLLVTMFLLVLGMMLLTYLPEIVQKAAGISDESTPGSEIIANILGTSVFPWLIASVFLMYVSLKKTTAQDAVLPEPPAVVAAPEAEPGAEKPVVKKRRARGARKK